MTRFEPMVLLWAARTSKWRLGNPNQISESWVRKDSVGISPEKFPCWKFLVTEQLAKIFTFSTNFCVTTEKISVFFLQNQFSWPNGQFMLWARHTYTESHWHKGSFGIFGDPLGASSDPPDLFAHRGIKVAPLAGTLSYCILISAGPFTIFQRMWPLNGVWK